MNRLLQKTYFSQVNYVVITEALGPLQCSSHIRGMFFPIPFKTQSTLIVTYIQTILVTEWRHERVLQFSSLEGLQPHAAHINWIAPFPLQDCRDSPHLFSTDDLQLPRGSYSVKYRNKHLCGVISKCLSARNTGESGLIQMQKRKTLGAQGEEKSRARRWGQNGGNGRKEELTQKEGYHR